METNAWITLKGRQEMDGQQEKFELASAGKYVKQGKKFYASYEGSEITGYDKSTTTLKISDTMVSMIRFDKGGVASQMIFEANKQYTGVYKTPYGSLSIDVCTKNIKIDVDENGGDIVLDYSIQLGGTAPVNNHLHVNIRKVD